MLNKNALLLTRHSMVAKAEMNMVPFIDVMLVLLVILLAANQSAPATKLDIPSVGQANVAPKEHALISVQANGSVLVTHGVLRAELPAATALPQLIKSWALPQQTPLLVQAAKSTDYGSVMAVVDQLRSEGYPKVGLAVNAKHEAR